jgi:fido (protein-threonine AMPylation protein)
VAITIKRKALLLVNRSHSNEIEALLIGMNWIKTAYTHYIAATITERLLTIHPFINGNGKVSRLIMNGILLQHGYLIAKLRLTKIHELYYKILNVDNKENKEDLILLSLILRKKV